MRRPRPSAPASPPAEQLTLFDDPARVPHAPEPTDDHDPHPARSLRPDGSHLVVDPPPPRVAGPPGPERLRGLGEPVDPLGDRRPTGGPASDNPRTPAVR